PQYHSVHCHKRGRQDLLKDMSLHKSLTANHRQPPMRPLQGCFKPDLEHAATARPSEVIGFRDVQILVQEAIDDNLNITGAAPEDFTPASPQTSPPAPGRA
ncbi:hypothetical protein FRC07_010353, partial [Ceratobasidium sp. 392]